MSWSGFKKSVNRAGTTMMQKVGQVEKSSDPEFDEFEARMKIYEKEATALQKESKGYLDSMRAMTSAQARIAETIDCFYANPSNDAMSAHAYRRAVEEMDSKTGREMDAPFRATVLEPAGKLVSYFPGANQAISKHHKKLLDYDAARSKVRKLTEKPSNDPNALPKAQHDLDLAEQAYTNINDALKEILPNFLDGRIDYYDPSFEAMIRMQHRFAKEGYEGLGGVQRYFDESVRDDYANGQLDSKVDGMLEEIRALAIVGQS